MADADFYSHDRPENPKLREDRPRGGGPKGPRVAHSRTWTVVAVIIAIIVVAIVGIALFP
ncbi:hypothetical protein [Streptomyces sp. NPDC058280]|uniref:hypothetical protein n=1 Tax=Streptomyces sp. NPDC058280 TaxID=3346419 RepID=UPI0036E16D29